MTVAVERPVLTELRLSAYKSHRGGRFPLGPVTVLAGGSGSGKSSVLEVLGVLAGLAAGGTLDEVLPRVVRGGAGACVPQDAPPDALGRRGFRVGCSADGPAGPVRLDLAVQVEPELRVAGERLTAAGRTLLSTALRDPARGAVEAAWHTAGQGRTTRAPLPGDLLATALLPLRVAGATEGERLVLDAAEQVLVALRAVFAVDPQPRRMRSAARVGDALLRGSCENLSAVLHRTQGECRTRHAALVAAAHAVCAAPVEGLTVVRRVLPAPGALYEGVLAAVDRGPLGLMPVDRLGDSELRFLALALVLLTGPGVLAMDHTPEVPAARQAMTVLVDGLDAGLDRHQTRELLSLAVRASGRGHVRLLGTAHGAAEAEAVPGVGVLALEHAPGPRRAARGVSATPGPVGAPQG